MNLLILAPFLAVMQPLVQPGGSVLLGWAITILIIMVVVSLIVWAVTKVIGPPSVPEQFKWVIWAIVIIGVIVFVFAALGIGIP